MKVFFVFFLVLVFGVVSSHGRTHEYNATTPFETSMTKLFDEFFLVQQWPESYCRDPLKPPCRDDIPSYFTVHGLWAQCQGAPTNCKGRKRFNPSCQLNPKAESNLKTYWPNLNGKDQEFWRRKLFNWPLKLNPDTDLEANLKEYWPNLTRNGEDCRFWEYEYDRHASCISPFQNDKKKYYSKTLELAMDSKFGNVTTMLSKKGIEHGSNYRISAIEDAIRRAINVKPTLECKKVDQTFLLFQIYLCFDDAFKLKDCRQPYRRKCRGSHGQISFPSPSRKPSQSLPVLSSTGKWIMN